MVIDSYIICLWLIILCLSFVVFVGLLLEVCLVDFYSVLLRICLLGLRVWLFGCFRLLGRLF